MGCCPIPFGITCRLLFATPHLPHTVYTLPGCGSAIFTPHFALLLPVYGLYRLVCAPYLPLPPVGCTRLRSLPHILHVRARGATLPLRLHRILVAPHTVYLRFALYIYWLVRGYPSRGWVAALLRFAVRAVYSHLLRTVTHVLRSRCHFGWFNVVPVTHARLFYTHTRGWLYGYVCLVAVHLATVAAARLPLHTHYSCYRLIHGCPFTVTRSLHRSTLVTAHGYYTPHRTVPRLPTGCTRSAGYRLRLRTLPCAGLQFFDYAVGGLRLSVACLHVAICCAYGYRVYAFTVYHVYV